MCIFIFYNENLCTSKRGKKKRHDVVCTDERLYLMLVNAGKILVRSELSQNDKMLCGLHELQNSWFVVHFRSNVLWWAFLFSVGLGRSFMCGGGGWGGMTSWVLLLGHKVIPVWSASMAQHRASLVGCKERELLVGFLFLSCFFFFFF